MVDMFAYLIIFDRDQPVGPICLFFYFIFSSSLSALIGFLLKLSETREDFSV